VLAPGLLGFSWLGIGLAVVVPLVFAAAGRVGAHPARELEPRLEFLEDSRPIDQGAVASWPAGVDANDFYEVMSGFKGDSSAGGSP
jgi:hypothetical protein